MISNQVRNGTLIHEKHADKRTLCYAVSCMVSVDTRFVRECVHRVWESFMSSLDQASRVRLCGDQRLTNQAWESEMTDMEWKSSMAVVGGFFFR